jgi:hypothetical protein
MLKGEGREPKAHGLALKGRKSPANPLGFPHLPPRRVQVVAIVNAIKASLSPKQPARLIAAVIS